MSSAKEQPMNPRSWTLYILNKRITELNDQIKTHQCLVESAKICAESSTTTFEKKMYGDFVTRFNSRIARDIDTVRKYELIAWERRSTTVLQAMHPRLGENSPIRVLAPEIMARICEML